MTHDLHGFDPQTFDQRVANAAQMTGAEINDAIEKRWDAGQRPRDDETIEQWCYRVSLEIMHERYIEVRTRMAGGAS